MMYDTCVCTLVHEKYSQATQILFREDILLFLTFCFCISTEIISLSQRKTKMKVFMVLFVQNQDLLAPLQKASSTSKKSTLYNGDNGTAIMNLIFQMEKTSVILLRKKKFASNNPCLYNNFVNNTCYIECFSLAKNIFSLELNLHNRNAASSNSSNSIEHETSQLC